MTSPSIPHAIVQPIPDHWKCSADPILWPWMEIRPLTPFLLAHGRGSAQQQTAVRLCHDQDVLFVHFDCVDQDIWGTYAERDDPIYDEEVVELFIAPGASVPVDYFELEISPNGVLLDASVHSPTGLRADMVVDFDWDCPGLRWQAVHDEKNSSWQAIIGVPLAELTVGRTLPAHWRANFYRIERPRDDAHEFSCWSPTLVEPADFHRPARFGLLELIG